MIKMSLGVAMPLNQTALLRIGKEPFVLTCLKANLSDRQKTHYDTLEVSVAATQAKIKSSYYKLTLKYHPDKNKSQDAKRKFQEISDAYKVLSNHNARKQYDMRMMVGNKQSTTIRNEPFKPKPEHFATYTMTSAPLFNYDEWNRMHYETTFRRSQERKAKYNEYAAANAEEALRTKNYPEHLVGIGFAICIIATAVGIMMFKSTMEEQQESKSSRKNT